MPETRLCPECGAAVPANSPAGLCPKCVLKGALESPSVESPARQATQSSPQEPATAFIPPTPAELAGKFPQLDILELLGRGGMGAVYKARQRGLDRLVAIKILPPDVRHDPAFAERFTREARSLARLNHPNIVGVYDFGQADGLYYFAMEFVDGVNLRQAIASGSVQAKDALAIVPQICDALQFAHNEGIVHRDIKPENILIDKKGRVKIADFGLAKLLGQEHSPDSLTATHQVMGTIRYMAPEQMEGSREVDHRADIYSLGVVFYEMLTGELPLGRFAPPSERVQIDIRLDEVVLRSLAKEPQRRYQQASEVKTDLEHISHSPPPAPPVLPPKVAADVPAEPDYEEARAQVRGPAIGLLVTGIIHCTVFPLMLIGILVLGYGYFSHNSARSSNSSESSSHEPLERLAPEASGKSLERDTEPKPEGNHG